MDRRWRMLAVVFLTRLAMGFQFQSIAAVAPLLVADLGLRYTEAGWLLGLFLLPGAAIALPGGVLGQRFGERRMALLGLAMMVAGGAALSASGGLPLASASRLVSGTGGVLMNVMLAKMVADWFAGKEISTAMGVMLTAWPAGIGLAVAALPVVAGRLSWRAAVAATAAAAGAALLLLLVAYRDPPAAAGASAPGRPRLTLGRRELALSATAGAAWAAFNASFIVLVSFGPAYLVARGSPAERAGLVVSLVMWVSLVSVPLGGLLADRVRRLDGLIVLGSLATALPMVAIPTLPGPGLWCTLVGAMVGVAPGALMALLPQVVPPRRLATGFGFYYAVYYLGVAVAQPAAGWLRDVTGDPAAPIFFAAALMAATVPALGAFRLTHRALAAGAEAAS